jgi:ribonuclease P protein component
VIKRLAARGATAIVLGCTEIMLLIGPEDSPLPLYDTTRLHAEAAVAFALPRRVGSAVTRNRVRRRLREICRDLTQSGELPVASYLFTARGDCTKVEFATLRRHVATAVQRAHGVA